MKVCILNWYDCYEDSLLKILYFIWIKHWQIVFILQCVALVVLMALVAANARVIVKTAPFYEYSGIPAYPAYPAYPTYYGARLALDGSPIVYNSFYPGYTSPIVVDKSSAK